MSSLKRGLAIEDLSLFRLPVRGLLLTVGILPLSHFCHLLSWSRMLTATYSFWVPHSAFLSGRHCSELCFAASSTFSNLKIENKKQTHNLSHWLNSVTHLTDFLVNSTVSYIQSEICHQEKKICHQFRRSVRNGQRETLILTIRHTVRSWH